MPAKHLNGNGHGSCKIHSRAAIACRACLVQGLQEFRLTNLRAGLRIAAKRISALREDYAAKGSAEVKAALVAYELGMLLARLQSIDDQVQDLPGDAGGIIRVMLKADGCNTVGKPA